MTYTALNLFTPLSGHVGKGFSIVRRIVAGIEASSLRSFNFNRYSVPPHIALRLNLIDDIAGKTAAEVVAGVLQKEDLVVDWKWEPYTEPELRPILIPPSEAATEAALLLADDLPLGVEKATPDDNLLKDTLWFLATSLNHAGFSVGYPSFDATDATLARGQKGAEILRRYMPQPPTFEFVERFVHLTCNCVGLGGEIEGRVRLKLAEWAVMEILAREAGKG